MIIGVPKEIKTNENRVALVPAGAELLVGAGSHPATIIDASRGGLFLATEAPVWPNALVRVRSSELYGKVPLESALSHRSAWYRDGRYVLNLPEVDIDRAEFYRPQLEGYRRVLARMTGLDPGRIEGRLLFLRADRVWSA